MRERERCCWCIHISDGVLLIGIYGASFHAGLLVSQCTYGPTLTPSFPLDPSADTVIHPILITVHVLGCIVNTLLVLGACTSQRVLMLPWLAGQGLLALVLACLALYYLVLYPDSNCYGSNSGGDCTLLLWHSVIMVLSLMLLIYYVYIVSDFVGQLKTRRAKDKETLEQMYTIERQEKRDQKREERQSVEWQQQILPESGVSKEPDQPRPPLEQGPILNERGLLQQFAQPSYLPDVSPFPLPSEVPPFMARYYPNRDDAPRAQFVHPIQILQVDHASGPVRTRLSQQDGYRLLSVLPAQSELPHYENQRGQDQLRSQQNQAAVQPFGQQPHPPPAPPPRPHKRPPPAPPPDDSDAAKGHYENAGYLRDDAAETVEGPPQRSDAVDSGGVTHDDKETETTGTTTAESAETTRSDQSGTDEKRKKRVRIFDPGAERDQVAA